MRRIVTPVLLLLAALLSARTVSAAPGLNLRWDACASQGVSSRSFACNTNTGTNLMVGSYVAPSGVTQLTGTEMALLATFDGGSVPSWWQMKNVGTCRQAALTMQVVRNPAWTACLDQWTTSAFGSIGSYTIGSPTANNVQIKLISAVFSGGAGPLTSGAEYFNFTLTISNVKTVGTGACTGCSTPGCVILQSIKLTQPVGVGDHVITTPVTSGSNVVTWQSVAPISCLGTPVRNTTWGSIRSLYR